MSGLHTGLLLGVRQCPKTKYSHQHEGNNGPLCRLDTRDLSGNSCIEGVEECHGAKKAFEVEELLVASEKNESRRRSSSLVMEFIVVERGGVWINIVLQGVYK